MIKINLLSEGKRPAAVRKAASTGGGRGLRGDQLTQLLFAGVVLLSLLGVGLWWWTLHSRQVALAEEIETAKKEAKSLEEVIKAVEQFKAQKAEFEHKIQVIKDLKNSQRGPVRLMDQISRALPELIWLTRVDMAKSVVKIQGKAFNSNAVAAFIEGLDAVAEFKEPELQELKQDKEIYNFSLQFAFKPAAAAVTPPAPADATGAPGAPAPDGGAPGSAPTAGT